MSAQDIPVARCRRIAKINAFSSIVIFVSLMVDKQKSIKKMDLIFVLLILQLKTANQSEKSLLGIITWTSDCTHVRSVLGSSKSDTEPAAAGNLL